MVRSKVVGQQYRRYTPRRLRVVNTVADAFLLAAEGWGLGGGDQLVRFVDDYDPLWKWRHTGKVRRLTAAEYMRGG